MFQTIPFGTHRAVVLVVEDDVSLRTTMCAVPTLKHYLPIAAENVDTALKILGAAYSVLFDHLRGLLAPPASA